MLPFVGQWGLRERVDQRPALWARQHRGWKVGFDQAALLKLVFEGPGATVYRIEPTDADRPPRHLLAR